MPLYYNAADAVLIASSTEGSPTTAKEALACNTPLVSTDVGDIKECFNFLPSVFICEPTAEALGDALLKATNLDASIESQKFAHSFSSGIVAAKLTQLYRAALPNNTTIPLTNTFSC